MLQSFNMVFSQKNRQRRLEKLSEKEGIDSGHQFEKLKRREK